MCGIVGVADPELAAEQIRNTLHRMNDRIVHRGPDDEGIHADVGVGIGMRRLSIIDLAGGQQPISNETNDVHVVCNGEIYNFDELRAELISRGHQLKTRSDTEVIVHLYEELGERCFTKLRGMFGIAILDQRKHRLVVGRDRLGKKPLFYSTSGGKFRFGSELNSLLAVDRRLSEPDYSVISQYLQFSYIYQPNTIYQYIKKIPAGCFGIYDLQNGDLSIERYWELQFPDAQSGHAPQESREDWQEKLDNLLLECVKVRLQSEVPLGVFLSGGIDSSAIVAYAQRAGLNPMKTFTIGFDRAEWDETEDAQRVADHFGTDHHVLELTEHELRSTLPDSLLKIVQHCGEPFGDDSALPTYHVSRLAREHVTVILSGDGGDELFGGYTSYRGAQFAQAYRRRVPYLLGNRVLPSIASSTARLLPERLRYQALRVAKILRDSSLPFEQAYRDKTSIWNARELRELLSPEVLENSSFMGDQYLPDDLWATLHTDRDVVSRLTDIDIRSYMLDDILVKVDRMSMAHSLEVRSPLLDHNMVEFAASMPSRFKIEGRRGKAILRDALAKYVPPKTSKKKKQGFSVPVRDWFRHGLSEMASDYLEYDGGLLPSSLFEKQKVQQVLAEHRSGHADHGRKIWLLMVFAVWHQQYQTGGTPQCVASLES
ncbi:asparagine synthase (glutamine-hydrolyzing) [Planctomycetota bacterium]